MMKLKSLLPVSLLALCAVQSCHTSGQNEPSLDRHVDDAMLTNVPDSARSDVADARESASVARDAYAAAQVETTRAVDRRKLADRDMEIAEAQVKRAQEAVKIAESGTQADLDKARQDLAEAQTVVTAAHSRITLRDRQVDHARAMENLKERNNELAQAKVEAVKAHAVAKLDRPDAAKVDVNAFERQVRDAQENVNLAQVRLDAARKEVDAARKSFDTDTKAVPAAYRRDWPKEEEMPKG